MLMFVEQSPDVSSPVFQTIQKYNFVLKVIKPLIKEIEGRKNQMVGKIHSKSETVVVELWDAEREDGDIISVYLNDVAIIKRVEMIHKPKVFEVKLKPGGNSIIFKADNLGSIPPNTAIMKIYGDGFHKIIQLSTDFQRNNVLEVDWIP
jgi:hypothetical protein